jgi:hypothetical protein
MLNKFKPKVLAKNLIRLGPKKDSGYVLHKNILNNNSVFLLSLGVGFEIGFEKDIIKNFNKKNIILVDYSSSDKEFVSTQLSLLLKFKLYRFSANLYRYFFFKKFIISNKKFINFLPFFVSDNNKGLNVKLSDLLETNKKVFSKDLNIIKIDIERSEYLILNENTIKQISIIFDVVLIEFHGLITFNEQISKINELFKTHKYFIGHYHNNNTVPFHEKFEMNNCFEVTYLSSKKFKKEKTLNQEYPLKNIDYSCNPKLKDVEFTFKN